MIESLTGADHLVNISLNDSLESSNHLALMIRLRLTPDYGDSAVEGHALLSQGLGHQMGQASGAVVCFIDHCSQDETLNLLFFLK